ncbi:peptidase S24/S26A/S26B/S26C [Aspergillus filifer]
MEQTLRTLLRHTTPSSITKFLYRSLGIGTATIILWENVFMFQASEGPSMYPTFSPRGDCLLVSKLHKYGRGIEVGDVVRFYHPHFLGANAAKRVIGLPGDYVCREGVLSEDVGGEGKMIRVPEGHVYVAGDNLPWSRDSRTYGPLPMGLINGKVIARIWPPTKMKWVENTLKPVEEGKGAQ